MSPTYSTVRTVRPVAGSRVAALTARSQATGQLPHDHPYESYGIGRPPLVMSARPCLSQHLVVRPDERSGPMRHRSISVPGSSLELRSAPITRSAPIALPPPGGIKSAEISISCGMAVPAQGGPSQGRPAGGSAASGRAPLISYGSGIPECAAHWDRVLCSETSGRCRRLDRSQRNIRAMIKTRDEDPITSGKL
jgi:hypothetical protein